MDYRAKLSVLHTDGNTVNKNIITYNLDIKKTSMQKVYIKNISFKE